MFQKKKPDFAHFPRPAETDPYVFVHVCIQVVVVGPSLDHLACETSTFSAQQHKILTFLAQFPIHLLPLVQK